MDCSAQHSVFLLFGEMTILILKSYFVCHDGRGHKNDGHYIYGNRCGKDLMFAKFDRKGNRFSTFLRIFEA